MTSSYAEMMTAQQSKRAPAERLLDAAGDLFTKEGIRAVGVDRVLASAGVARASLYHAFGSKDGLVAAYLERQDAQDRAAWENVAAQQDDPTAKILLLFDLAKTSAVKRQFRGCLYLNAATEFPDHSHPVAEVIAKHRQWLRDSLLELVHQLGVHAAGEAVNALQLIYDGAQAGSKACRSTEPFDLGKKLAEQTIEGYRADATVDNGRAHAAARFSDALA